MPARAAEVRRRLGSNYFVERAAVTIVTPTKRVGLGGRRDFQPIDATTHLVAGIAAGSRRTAFGPRLQESVAMPQTPHVEKHFTASDSVRDIVIGMADGLTVPFALAAGLSGAVSSSGIIVTAGLAEVAAGAIAMGLGGYLAARTDVEHYHSERVREEREADEMPEQEAEEVADVLRSYGLEADHVEMVVRSICADKQRWVDFMMRFELGLEAPDPKRAGRSAFTIALSYVAGGLVPLAPYFVLKSVHSALLVSVLVTLLALFVFGYVKGRFTTARPFRSAWQTVLVGGIAATAAFIIAKSL